MYITALLIGLLGSLHCVAMCSPITLLIGVKATGWKYFTQRISYNLGRLVGYAILGLLVGFFGKMASFFGVQQGLTVAFGVVLLIGLLLYGSDAIHNPSIGFLNRVTIYLKRFFAKVYQWTHPIKSLVIGVLNGFLPCGLVYMALIGAMTMPTIVESIVYMVLFGVGTLPMMLAVAFFGQWVKGKIRLKNFKIVPYIIAILFIIRGLNLGIPYLSPKINETQNNNIPLCNTTLQG